MGNLLDIAGLRPLTPEEESAVQEFMAHMESVVIPQIVEEDFINRIRVAEARNWFVN